MSYLADPANPPKTGDVFYVSLSATGIGNTCAGIYAYPQLILPAGVSLAISGAHPVQCFLKFPNSNSFTQDTSSDCPQSLSAGAQGYNLTFIGGNGFWPLPPGGTIEMHVPVKSTVAGALTIGSYIQTADGEGNGVMAPSLVAIVDPAATPPAQQIGIEYGDPSISNQVQAAAAHRPGQRQPARFRRQPQQRGQRDRAAWPAADRPGDELHGARISDRHLRVSSRSAASRHWSSNVNTQISGTFTTLYPAYNYCWRIRGDDLGGDLLRQLGAVHRPLGATQLHGPDDDPTRHRQSELLQRRPATAAPPRPARPAPPAARPSATAAPASTSSRHHRPRHRQPPRRRRRPAPPRRHRSRRHPRRRPSPNSYPTRPRRRSRVRSSSWRPV